MAKFIKSSYEILTDISEGGLEELKLIEKACRVCYKSEDKITDDGESAKALIKSCLGRGHESPIEHSILTVKFVCDRGVTHEMVRHRLASYSQESTRYCNYSKDKFGNEITFVLPDSYFDDDGNLINEECALVEACRDAETHYFRMINDEHKTPQEARAVLPQCLKAEIIMSANYREWRHFFELRCSKAAHPDIRKLACGLRDELRERIPVIFD